MAIGEIRVICQKCGMEFTRRTKLQNRAQAESWQAWAKENITICPDCYRKEQEEAGHMRFLEITKEIEFPEITGRSEKQTAYAKRLRERFVLQNEKKFRRFREEQEYFNRQWEALPAEIIASAEAKAGVKGRAGLWQYILKENGFLEIQLVLTEPDAGKLIDALKGE